LKCGKCGGFAFTPCTRPYFEADTNLQRVRTLLARVTRQVEEQKHRKARFIICNLRRADDAVTLACEALRVAGDGVRNG